MNLSAFQSHPFRRYLVCIAIALHGVWIQRIVVAWLAWDVSSSPAFVGFATFLSFVPTMITGPFFGVVADRIEIRVAIYSNYIAMLLVTLTFIVSAYVFGINKISLVFFATVIGITASANHPFRMSIAARLGSKEKLSSIIAITTLNFNISRLVGPAIGGLLLAQFGPTQTLWVTCVGFLPIILLVRNIKIRPRDVKAKSQQHVLSALRDGLSYTKRDRFMLYIFGLTICVTMVGRGLLETLPIIAQGMFDKGPNELGLLTASAGGGAILASFAKAVGKPQEPGTVGFLGILSSILVPISIISLGFSRDIIATAGLLALLGFSATFFATTMQSAAQLQLTDEFRGRVMSLWTMIAMGGGAIGALILGAVSEIMGISITFIVLGGITTIITIFILLFASPSGQTRL